ncbi:Multidrug efflux system EmrAB-OMF, inner-membrane proton/drug antiporter EmrB (MFS type) [Pseudomonas sp. R2-37-08W]|uniref:DHA2 family efflux MFS transporter permease subunit n=1 Tax=unclassified Pseudomonas TaxID=196821 RepID=UPI000F5788EB|nr:MULTISPECIES: DHA2 family efflux MFS transporter permease subunit [unclassified Pseudomonas]AZF11462.1 Multidrug efflux system EmrAB-OMF, inner-membrane proton/drug antiporter EmrB (MFS type) [Pseudomonas sp. R2-37-08W]AZF38122.1 Multidrug efflux system EmrAB-OMF, inner-membrane proton/drug antiporter EmrB (MFS type) [Pseudomonas sp. R4-39-08]AZF43190.1 Multidrug efflux system EmrAB-OMF, inner-membrane proton/drug antiporter EmrB (MFS type) [Pseudomonas sp. R1-43-08]AZF48425.1 Multidrug effl
MSNNASFTPPSLVMATIGLSLATFMQVLDTTIANVALPTISGNLGVSSEQGTWVITSFAVSNAIALPLTGWLSRRFGEVKLFLWATLLFVLASFLCGISTSMPELIGFRVLQGLVAGPLYPMTQTLLIAVYPPAKRGMALALLAMVTVVAPIAGPILGGWITDSYSWPWIFFINVPIGIFAVMVVRAQLKKRPVQTSHQPMDYVGLLSLIVGVGALQIILDKGNDLDWFESNFIIIGAAISVIALAVFVIWEMTDKHPVVNLRLFAYRNFRIGTIVLVGGYAGFFGINLILPQWLQTQMGYTATWAGLAVAPIGILPVLMSPFVGKYAHKFDLRLLAGLSFLAMGLSCFMRASFTNEVDFQHIALVQLFMGIGVALFFMPTLSILMSDLPPQQIADGAGLATFLRTLGGSFAASLTTWIWIRRADQHHAYMSENMTVYDSTTRDAVQALGGAGHKAYAQLDQILTSQAYMMSTVDYFTLMGWVFVGLMLLVWLAKPPFGAKAGPEASGH